MIFRRGQIDQIITSILVVVFAFFLSGLFILVSSNIAYIFREPPQPLLPGNGEPSEAESSALLDLFLSDSVELEGELISVRELFSRFESNPSVYTPALERLFAEHYSCAGSNVLVVVLEKEYSPRGSRTDDEYGFVDVTFYIDYPRQSGTGVSLGTRSYVQQAYTFTSLPSFEGSYVAPASARFGSLVVGVGVREASCLR